jgi:hypothetical protein
MTDKEKEREKE